MQSVCALSKRMPAGRVPRGWEPNAVEVLGYTSGPDAERASGIDEKGRWVYVVPGGDRIEWHGDGNHQTGPLWAVVGLGESGGKGGNVQAVVLVMGAKGEGVALVLREGGGYCFGE